MDLITKLNELATRIPKQQALIQTEEATKNAFIMPFISALGYDVFNPSEVIPEFTADTGTKKGEKVDYAIKKDNDIIILIECKWSGEDLNDKHASQLYRYFSVTESRFAILTNGIEYQFYSDIDERNKMDERPFFIFNMLHFQKHAVAELTKFTKTAFSLDDILTTASTLKYTNAIKKILEKELHEPSEAFIRFFVSQVFDGRITKPILDSFGRIVKEARRQFINEKISDRLNNALTATAEPEQIIEEVPEEIPDNGIITTEDEIDAYHIVKAIVRKNVDVKRVIMRDTKSYCGILLDDNNRKPICRLHFNYSQKYLGVLTNKKETKIPIDDINDIFEHEASLIATIAEYENNNVQ